jgi:hypothetical protein
MTLEQRAEAIAAAVQRLREGDDDDFEGAVTRVALEHLVAASIETAARVMRRSMASEHPTARAN